MKTRLTTMKILSAQLLLPIATLAALAACTGTVPSGSTALTTSQPVVTSVPATTTTTTTTNGPTTTSYISPFAGSSSQTSSTTTTTVVSSPARLNAAEISALLSDNTASGTASNGQNYAMLFRHDSQLKFREGQFRDRGGWRVASDGLLCATLKVVDVGMENCYTLSRNGTNIDLGGRDGAKVGSFTVLPGDPQNLTNI
jgi:hypothetical protein